MTLEEKIENITEKNSLLLNEVRDEIRCVGIHIEIKPNFKPNGDVNFYTYEAYSKESPEMIRGTRSRYYKALYSAITNYFETYPLKIEE